MHNMEKCGRGKGRPQGCSLRSHRRRRLAPLPPPFSSAPMLRHVVYASLLHFEVETAVSKAYRFKRLAGSIAAAFVRLACLLLRATSCYFVPIRGALSPATSDSS